MLLSLYSLSSRVNVDNGYGRRLRQLALYLFLMLTICWAAEILWKIAADVLINLVAPALGGSAADVLEFVANIALEVCMTEYLRPWIARQLRPLILVCSWTDKCFQKVTVRVGSQAVQ